MTPYASQLKAEITRVSRGRMVFATFVSAAAYVGAVVLSFELLEKSGMEWISLVTAGLASGVVGALSVPVRSELDQRMLAGLRGIFLVVCVAVVVGVAVAIFEGQWCVAILFTVFAIVISVPALTGAFFGVLIANAFLIPIARQARRNIRARRWDNE